MLAYETLLNSAQYRVVSSPNGPMLVIAGAGTGKTRTIVFRLAWLVEHGVAPHNILLLTFTRKAAREMLDRATDLLGADLNGLYGGTFHAFAYRILRKFKPFWLEERPFSVMDSTDQQEAVKRCREESGIGKGIRGFPKTQAIVGLFSKARNKEQSLQDILQNESPQILPYSQELGRIHEAYQDYKHKAGLLDYDDLLYELEDVLQKDPEALRYVRSRYQHILVDEYQDTNLVQARLIEYMAGELTEERSVMAVGDEAQSIYAFRGATVRNILDFPNRFPNTRIVALEENYRSVQPVLQVANRVMSFATEGYAKVLKAVRTGGSPARVICCGSDVEQGKCVARRVEALLKDNEPSDIAVLFRSGYQSYQVEAELTALGIRYRKYGGLRIQEAAHVKDLLAYLHLIINPRDYAAFSRVALMHDKIGPRTAEKIFAGLDVPEAENRFRKSHPRLFEELDLLTRLAGEQGSVADTVREVMTVYEPHLQELYPEDASVRWLGLQEIASLASAAEELDLFVAELLLDSVDQEEQDEDFVTLSTIHSAKGLEWKHVLILDLVEGRLPSRFALLRQETMEEERRLMYVACTRAKDNLELYWYRRSESAASYGGDSFCTASTFLDELEEGDRILCKGSATGRIIQTSAASHSAPDIPAWRRMPAQGQAAQAGEQDGKEVRKQARDENQEDGPLVPALEVLPAIRAGSIRKCRHSIFGEGLIMGVQDNNVLQIKFPVLGIKNIMASFIYVQSK